MKYATFVAEVQPKKSIGLPAEVCEKLRIETGDRLEVSIKKIKSNRLDLMLAENPLYRLLGFSEANNDNDGNA